MIAAKPRTATVVLTDILASLDLAVYWPPQPEPKYKPGNANLHPRRTDTRLAAITHNPVTTARTARMARLFGVTMA
jgi:hypothetical protein